MSDAFTYRDLNAWKQAMTVVEECYRCTEAFPRSERFGLVSQIRRAAVSIPANIAEGRCRHTTGAFTNHISIAVASVGELETCIELGVRLGFLKLSDATRLSTSVSSLGRLLNALHRSLQAKLDQIPAP
jgi:four helix bundle protein